jgi:hypothetical protein
MAATILAKDVLRRVSVQLTDAPNSAGQFVRWTEQELVDWLNDGQRVIAKYLPQACSRIDAIKLSAGTRQSIEKILAANIKTGDGTVATTQYGKSLLDVIRNMGADGLSPGRAVRVVERETLDASSPKWHTEVTDTEVTEYTFDPRTPKFFYVSPGVKAAAALWVELSYLANPTDVPYVADSMRLAGGSLVPISIDDQYVDDLVNYMLARGHMKEAEVAGNAQLAAGFVSMFTSSINAQSQVLNGVNPNLKSLPMNATPIGQAS